MLAKDLISDLILPLRTSDTAATALSWMEELRVSHLPIVNNEVFLGLISDSDIYSINEPDTPLGNHQLSLTRPYVSAFQHIFEVIRSISSQKLTLVPVLDEHNNYLGCITLARIIDAMAELAAVTQPGGIVVLELNAIDYSLHEISRIVESNDTRILSCYTRSTPDSNKMEVTLKLNKIDLSRVIQTFNRYDYIITASYSEENDYDDLLRDRFESLMSYLNI